MTNMDSHSLSQEWNEVELDEVHMKLPRTSFSSQERSRKNTRSSNISQLESSWEDIHPGSVPPALRSRSSTGGSYQKHKSKHHHGFRLPSLFSSHRQDNYSVSRKWRDDVLDEMPEPSNSPTPGAVSGSDSNAAARRVANVPGATADQKSQKPQRVRLTASEGDSNDGISSVPKGRRSSSTVGEVPILRSVVLSGGIRREPSTGKRNRKITLKQSRSIGIVAGEDFVMNPTNGDKIVSYLNSAWNNVKYGWTVKPKVHISMKMPVWILGECYTVGNRHDDEEKKIVFEKFMSDFRSRMWFTYRRDFPMLAGSTFTSDCGWGCMIRSGQMMLGEALSLHFLKREWRWEHKREAARDQEAFHRQIVKWCGDNATRDQLFGIHKLVTVGQQCGKRAGDWYGPGSVAHILQKALTIARNENPLLQDLHVYVSQDGTIFKGDIADMRKAHFSSSEREAAVVILVPVRLGGDKINPLYIPCLKDLLTLKFSLGIIGGRPQHSLYFVGWQEDSLIYLDPHLCQDTVDVSERTFKLKSFHCSNPRKLAMSNMDPSCTLGFYCRNLVEYEEFVDLVAELQLRHCKEYPMFSFSQGRLSDYDHEGLDLKSFEADRRDKYNDQTDSFHVQSQIPLDDFHDFVVL